MSDDNFVRMLTVLCDRAKVGEEHVNSFKEKLKSISPLIKHYSCIIHDEKEGLQKRRNIAKIINKIEAMPMVDKLMRDFSCEHEMADFNMRIRKFLKNN